MKKKKKKYGFLNKLQDLQDCGNKSWFSLQVYLLLLAFVLIVRYDLNKKLFSTFLKRTRLSRKLSTIAAAIKLWAKVNAFSMGNNCLMYKKSNAFVYIFIAHFLFLFAI